MKTLKIFSLFLLLILHTGCEEDVELYDFEKYKFVSFIDQEITLPETYSVDAVNQGKEEGFPIYLEYAGSVLDEDFTTDVEIVGNVAKEGVDFSVATKTILFKAGFIKSEPFYLTLIDDLINSTEDRSLEISIISVSNPNIDIGVGIVNQANKSIIVNILDNECSETLDIFNLDALKTSSNRGEETIKGTFNNANSILKLEGNLISYGPLNAVLEIQLNPLESGAKVGTVSFDDYDGGTDSDGYDYTFKQVGESDYDICKGEINFSFEVYYSVNGGSESYWFTLNTKVAIE